MEISKILGRQHDLLVKDMENKEFELKSAIEGSRILVVGAAGSIGQSVARELFCYNPKALHLIDLSENNLVELVRTIRSTVGYGDGEFKTFALDSASKEFDALSNANKPYDYIFNLSALKHVRSESDPYTLMRLTKTNIFNSVKLACLSREQNAQKYFCVSTDKAANPVNMMGASKRIMEMFLMRESLTQDISMARFANVAFSDGSLLHGFNQRFLKRQPISAPNDVRRYFITPKESGQLCILSGILGLNREIYFPKLDFELNLEKFSTIATRFLQSHGFEAVECTSEDEARSRIDELLPKMQWPVYFFSSDTTGEKSFEEFYTSTEHLLLDRYEGLGIIKSDIGYDNSKLDTFTKHVLALSEKGIWTKEDLLNLYKEVLPEFEHEEKGKYLDDRM